MHRYMKNEEKDAANLHTIKHTTRNLVFSPLLNDVKSYTFIQHNVCVNCVLPTEDGINSGILND